MMGTTTLAKPSASQRISAKFGKKRLFASPVSRIIDEETNQAVGWMYQWNTGEKVKIMDKEQSKPFRQ